MKQKIVKLTGPFDPVGEPKLELVGAETPPEKPARYEITPKERVIIAAEYEAQCALNFAKLGAPTKRNARALLMGACRMAWDTGVTFDEWMAEASDEWTQTKKAKGGQR